MRTALLVFARWLLLRAAGLATRLITEQNGDGVSVRFATRKVVGRMRLAEPCGNSMSDGATLRQHRGKFVSDRAAAESQAK